MEEIRIINADNDMTPTPYVGLGLICGGGAGGAGCAGGAGGLGCGGGCLGVGCGVACAS